MRSCPLLGESGAAAFKPRAWRDSARPPRPCRLGACGHAPAPDSCRRTRPWLGPRGRAARSHRSEPDRSRTAARTIPDHPLRLLTLRVLRLQVGRRVHDPTDVLFAPGLDRPIQGAGDGGSTRGRVAPRRDRDLYAKAMLRTALLNRRDRHVLQVRPPVPARCQVRHKLPRTSPPAASPGSRSPSSRILVSRMLCAVSTKRPATLACQAWNRDQPTRTGIS
jgi:hypothetical protein